MMSMRARFLLMAVLIVGVAACASEPIQFYTLIPPDSAAPPTAVAGAAYQIEMLPVEAPTQVDGPQMVLRRGGGEILLLETRRWIAPVADEVRSAISNRLTRELGTTDVYGLSRTSDAAIYRIKVELNRFESYLDRSALIEATWSVRKLDTGAAPLVCKTRTEEPVTAGFPALVEGHQRAVARIADAIAASLRQMATAQAASCP